MNSTITSVPGVLAGHFTHPSGTTGTTAVVFPEGAVASGFVPGSAPGSREHGLFDPRHLAPRIHGVCFSGGSAFGLCTADGVMAALADRGIGMAVGAHTIPLVPAAILFDLPVSKARPEADWGRQAVDAAGDGPLPAGRVGAGAGARVGLASGTARPGGLGCAARSVAGGRVAALAVVNAFGSVVDPSTGAWVVGGPPVLEGEGAPLGHTTLVLVVTDAPLDKAGCAVVSRMAAAGLARTLVPAFAPVDGDTVIVASTGASQKASPGTLARLGHTASECVAEAILSAVRPGRPTGAGGGSNAQR